MTDFMAKAVDGGSLRSSHRVIMGCISLSDDKDDGVHGRDYLAVRFVESKLPPTRPGEVMVG